MKYLTIKKRIAVLDCDDILLVFIKAFQQYVEKNFHRVITLERFSSYIFCDVYGVPQKTMDTWMKSFYNSVDFANLAAETGAHELLCALFDAGYLCVCVTARTSSTRDVTENQFEDKFPGKIEAVNFTRNTLTGKRWKKSELILHLYDGRLDFFADDAGHNIIDVAQVFPKAKVVLLSRDWNQDYVEAVRKGISFPNITVVEDLRDSIVLIE